MSDPAICISKLSKAYRIQRDDRPHATNLGEAIGRKIRAPFKKTPSETFWALKDIDLEINRGEVVGVIGRNGAGKSTLLKVLSRITEPTTGRIELFGRVGSLLEVGTGFHPELSGRENIFLNGAILGMKRGEIKKQFDEIVDFAGVEKFLDTPVKRYSSGMYVRLAFAVAAHLNPEILIVDEVLAVGDAEFQKKCLGKMRDVAQSGRTVLFVSHNVSAITSLCSMGVWLDKGVLTRVGVPRDLLAEYALESSSHQVNAAFESPDSPIAFACIESPNGTQVSSHVAGEDLRIRLELNVPSGDSSPEVGVGVTTSDGVRVCTAASSFQSPAVELPRSGEVYCVIKNLSLTEGLYSIRLGLDCSGISPFRQEDALCFEVVSQKDRGCRSQLRVHGVVETDSCWHSLPLSET